MHCKICGKPAPIGYHTCGSSRCQESDHYFNRARNLRKGSKAQKEAQEHAQKCAAIARGI